MRKDRDVVTIAQSGADVNRRIFDTDSSVSGLATPPTRPYDRRLAELRLDLVRKYAGARDTVLDLGCGVGAYFHPVAGRARRGVGMDFSRKMLGGFLRSHADKAGVSGVQGDAQNLPFRDVSFDCVFSYCALYYVPGIGEAVRECVRVLRPGGHAVLELGNRHSLNNPVNLRFHEAHGWARPQFAPIGTMLRQIREAGLEIVEHRTFQILPMYGTPEGMRHLLPLLTPRWKAILGLAVGGKMLDEWISSSPLLRRFAFRHIVVARKP